MQCDFTHLKAQEEIFSPHSLTQDWPLTTIELGIHPQDFLSCSGLLCSSDLHEMQRGSENSPFMFAVNKGSVLQEFGGLRLLGVERFEGSALKLSQHHWTTFAETLEVFESVSSH